MADTSERFAAKHQIEFVGTLGHGKDGRVFETTRRRAVKFFGDMEIYRREFRAYQILSELNIHEIDGFQIPRFIRSDEELLAIEMSIVQPPFLLDFAAAYSEDEIERFDFSDDVLSERELHWAEIFGDRWPVARGLVDHFQQQTGLTLLDLSLNNIRFA